MVSESSPNRRLVLRRVIEATTAAAGHARTAVVEWLRRHGCARATTDDAALIVSELVSNAAEAGDDPVSVELELLQDAVEIRVTNSVVGAALPPRDEWGPAHPLANRGRGLLIVDALADSVEVDATDRSVSVRAVLKR